MKLFSWMHRKAKTDITSPVMGSATGLKSSLDNQGIYATPNNNYSTLKWLPQNSHYFKYSSGENYEELNTRENDEIFPGFLTIGTLNVEPVTEPSTPTFGFTSQDIDEEVTANIKHDLKHISEDLEKFLGAEMEGTNKSTSNKGQASTITLNDEVKEEVSDAAPQLYPLQGYLLGSSTEECSSKETEEKGKMSLHRLFKRRIMMRRNSISEDEESDKKAAEEIKSLNRLTNKMLQKPPICSEVSVRCAVKALPKVTKPNKIKSLFHKKIHPEISKGAGEDIGFSIFKNVRAVNKSTSPIRKSHKIGCWTYLAYGKKHRSRTGLISPADTITDMNSALPAEEMAGCACKEHWIKTDEEFFVLELQENKGQHVYQ